MANTYSADFLQVPDRHYHNLMASLSHRLKIARAANNQPLLHLLEQEQQQIVAQHRQVQPSSSLSDWLRLLWQKSAFGMPTTSALQFSQIEAGGDRWWYAYNPRTRQSTYAGSDEQLLLWLKEHDLP